MDLCSFRLVSYFWVVLLNFQIWALVINFLNYWTKPKEKLWWPLLAPAINWKCPFSQPALILFLCSLVPFSIFAVNKQEAPGRFRYGVRLTFTVWGHIDLHRLWSAMHWSTFPPDVHPAFLPSVHCIHIGAVLYSERWCCCIAGCHWRSYYIDLRFPVYEAEMWGLVYK